MHKKVLNSPSNVVKELLQGAVESTSHLLLLEGHQVVLHDEVQQKKNTMVSIVTGGGSGHEPFAAGFVGSGLISAAVAGDVFASPKVDSILAAILAVTGEKGCLLLVLNYTGDRLNFGVAASLARSMGKQVELVLVGDDCALVQDQSHAGRRGLAGMVLVCKIAGAVAAQGESLATVAKAAQETADAVRTMGVALKPCVIPGAHSSSFSLPDDVIEIGLGIHGEPGVRQEKLRSADDLVKLLLDRITSDLQEYKPQANKNVVLLVNSLGATPPMELSIITLSAVKQLEERGYTVERVYSGLYVTSLEMAGFSLTLLPSTEKLSRLLDAPTNASAFPLVPKRVAHKKPLPTPLLLALEEHSVSADGSAADARVEKVIGAIVARLIKDEEYLTQLDQVVGDGDMGTSLKKAATDIEAALPKLSSKSPSQVIRGISNVLRCSLGGTSGPLYTIFALRVAEYLLKCSNGTSISPVQWAMALQEGAKGVSELGGAHVGDRTMVDALVPATDALVEALQKDPANVTGALKHASETARKRADETKNFPARKGRSSYLGSRAVGNPDPGAVAVAVQFEAATAAITHL